MKKLFSIFLAAGLAGSMQAQEATWLRGSAISPDGQTIVFGHRGDLYTVPATGGRATRLTSHRAYDGFPQWSPDGSQIAFSSDRYGGMDVFVMPATGGRARRLTTHSAQEYVQAWLDNQHILYTASIQADQKDLVFPGGFSQVWQVDTEGHRPRLFSSLTMESIHVNGQGDVLYQNKKGYEDDWRKHHRSPICRDIMLTQASRDSRSYRQLTTDNAEHRDPRWAADGKAFYFLSEKDGTLNIWRSSTSGGSETQLTHYKKHPVRHLSVARDGTICFSWDGSLYTMKEGGQPRKLQVDIMLDDTEEIQQPRFVSSGAGTFDVTKDAKEIAFSLNGDIYTTTPDYETTRQITHTPQAESAPSFSPDGRTIAYCAERGGQRNLYWTRLTDSKDKRFTYATDLKEEQLTKGSEPCILPKWSPDGKKIAFIANKSEIRVMDVKSKRVSTVLPAQYNFSYSDGDVDFEWSPDSRWILTTYMGTGGWNNQDIAAVSVDGKQVVNLTQSGYSDGDPHWALGGKAIVWESDRAGYRSHGSWGAESDAYIMFLDRELYAKAQLNKEDRELYEARAKDDSVKTADNKDKKSPNKDKAKDNKKKSKTTAPKDTAKAKTDSVKPLKLDFEDCEERVMRLTINSSHLGNFFLSPDGKKFYYTTRYEGGYDLWEHNLEKNSTRILKKGLGGGRWCPNKAGTEIYICNGTINKLTLASGEVKNLPFRAETESQSAAQREYIFDHAVQQIENRFCETDFHGVDFKALSAHYRQFLPAIGNSRDLGELMSELLGELNCSHTGMKYRPQAPAKTTANLGAFFDEKYEGDGLKIAEIVKDGPLDLPNKKIKEGFIVKEIDHQKILARQDYFPLLAGKAGKWVRLTMADTKGKTFDIHVKACSQGTLNQLLYKRWVKHNEEFTRQYSKGQIGYVHIEAMNSPSYRKIYSEILGKYRNCKALVVDERHNGGGWLHGDLAILLSGKQFQTYTSRGQYLGNDPFTRWNKPSCVMICEDCYSNAHGFPAMYKALELGKLVGSPIAGTMTAVWWEYQVDPSLILGIPEVNCLDMDGKTCENQQLDPDIPVALRPADQLTGNDTQLKAAIDHMLGLVK